MYVRAFQCHVDVYMYSENLDSYTNVILLSWVVYVVAFIGQRPRILLNKSYKDSFMSQDLGFEPKINMIYIY